MVILKVLQWLFDNWIRLALLAVVLIVVAGGGFECGRDHGTAYTVRETQAVPPRTVLVPYERVTFIDRIVTVERTADTIITFDTLVMLDTLFGVVPDSVVTLLNVTWGPRRVEAIAHRANGLIRTYIWRPGSRRGTVWTDGKEARYRARRELYGRPVLAIGYDLTDQAYADLSLDVWRCEVGGRITSTGEVAARVAYELRF